MRLFLLAYYHYRIYTLITYKARVDMYVVAGGHMEEEQQQMEEGMSIDELSMRRSSDFFNALEELKNLRPQFYHAAEYCEKSYLVDQHKRKVLENSKDYTVKALVNAVDHLGNVASQLNGLLSQEAAEIAATGVRIHCLKQRVLTCKEYTDGKGLRQQCLVQTFPRYHSHYVLPGTETGLTGSSSGNESYISQDSMRARQQATYQGETLTASTLISNPPFRNKVLTISSSSASACKTFGSPEVRVSVASTSTTSSRSQSAAGTPRSPISSTFFGDGLKDPMEGTKSSFSFGNSHKTDVRQPTRSMSLLTSFLHGRKSAKKRPNHVQ